MTQDRQLRETNPFTSSCHFRCDNDYFQKEMLGAPCVRVPRPCLEMVPQLITLLLQVASSPSYFLLVLQIQLAIAILYPTQLSAVLFLHIDRREHMCNAQLISTMIIQALCLLKTQYHSMSPYLLPLASLPFKDHHFTNYTEYNQPIKYILKKSDKVGEMLQSAFSLTCDSHSSFLATKNMKYPQLKLRCCKITTHIGLWTHCEIKCKMSQFLY